MTDPHRGGPLEGVRVLEITKVWAGPYAGKQLAYLGAEVIKVESLGSLDVTRIYGVDDMNKSPGFQSCNPQKLSAQIDMKSPEGLKLLKELAAKCDIVIENLRPGAIARLGLGYEALREANPGIILVSMGMYGNDGPLAYQTGYAPCFVALSGLSSLVGYAGEPPAGMNMRYADSTFGNAAAFAALAALAHRNRTGEGQFVDLSAVEAMTSMIGDSFMDYSLTGTIRIADGNRHEDMAPHGLFHTQDEDWVSIAVQSDAAWARFADLLGVAGDPRFATLATRKANEDALEAIVAGWTEGQDARAIGEQLQAIGVAAMKSFNSVDLIADDHLILRGFYPEVTDKDGETKLTTGPAWAMTDAAVIDKAAPQLGEHNAYVFGEIMGLSEAEQARLAEAGAIR